MNNLKTGIILTFIGIFVLILFEGTGWMYLSLPIVLVGLGRMLKQAETHRLVFYENPKTEKDLEHWKYYERIHFSRSSRNNAEHEFRVVLESKPKKEQVFLLPDKPPKKFFWVNGKYLTPEQAIKERQRNKY